MYTIFTIDFENNPHHMNVFSNFIAGLNGKATGTFLPMIGSYEGKKEHCFICRTDDFEAYIRGTIYIKGQDSILHVAQGNKMEAWLEYLDDRKDVQLGHMHQVCEEEARASADWTYSPSLNAYWIAKEDNPDGSYARSVAAYRNPRGWEVAEPVADVEYIDAPVFDNTYCGQRYAAE